LFLKAVVEVRRGRRIVTVDSSSSHPARELATPTLAALEWALKPQTLALPPAAIAKMRELANDPPRPGPRLKAAEKRTARRPSRTHRTGIESNDWDLDS
jgi:hypothetical protein